MRTGRVILLVEGVSDPTEGKFATAMLRYRVASVVGLIDRETAGKTCDEVFGVGGSLVISASLDEAAPAETLLLGGAPPGGRIPEAWQSTILAAIRRGMTIVSGGHEFLSDDPLLAEAAAENNTQLIDLRKNNCTRIATGGGFRGECLRIHTVANTNACGKMTASLELDAGLRRCGIDSQFVATGQIGIALAENGYPIDRVIADFVSGASEELVLQHQHHEVLVVEGQGSLVDCRFSCVTLGLLHGCRPDGLIYCYQMGRPPFGFGGPGRREEPAIQDIVRFYETAASFVHPSRVIGIAVSGYGFSAEEVTEECSRIEAELGLPACDVLVHGAEKLVEATLARRQQLGMQRKAGTELPHPFPRPHLKPKTHRHAGS